MPKKNQARQGGFWHGRTGPRSRRRSRQAHRETKLRLEPLESRQMLDAGMAGELLETTTPDVEWLTYVGGAEEDWIYDVAVDGDGNYLIFGQDQSKPFDQTAFITKVSSSGILDDEWTFRLPDPYLFGSLAVDGDGNVVASGTTASDDWVSGGYDTTMDGSDRQDAFVLKLNGQTGEHLWSTLTNDVRHNRRSGLDIAVDSNGDIYLVGDHIPKKGDGGSFVLKISADGQQPLWSKLIVDSSIQEITLDSSEDLILTGSTTGSTDNNAIVMKLANNGDQEPNVEWSSDLGTELAWYTYYVAVDGGDNVLVAGGATGSNGVSDAYVAKLSPTGDSIWTTFVGGAQDEHCLGLAVDASGNALITGRTQSVGWVSGGFDSDLDGDSDAFVAQISPDGEHIWSSYLGGINFEDESIFGAIAYDPAGYAVVVGDTGSPDLSTDGSTLNGEKDGFVAKIRLGPPAPPEPGISVTPTSGLETSEAETTDAFDVVLDTQPTAAVTIDVSSLDTTEGVIEGSVSIVFDATNWDVPQTVTVLGVDDGDLDGDQVYTIQLAAAVSVDPDYNGLDPADVSVTNLDDEAPPVPTEIYVWDIHFETQGVFTTIVVDVRQDSNLNGSADSDDAAAVGTLVTVGLYDPDGTLVDTLTGTTDADGIFRSNSIKKLAAGTRAEVIDLALVDFEWDPLGILDPTLNDVDADGDGLPDQEFTGA